MDADHVVDHEFQPRQAHAGIRRAGEFEGQLGIADVHHDLHRQRRQVADILAQHVEFQRAAINIAGIALGAGNGDLLAFGQHGGGIAATDDGRNAQFAGDDRGMTGAAAAIGDDGRSPLHHRFPVRVGHVGDQHVADLHAVHFARVFEDAHGADTDFLTDGAAADQHLAMLLELVFFQHRSLFLRFHGFRPRLQDVQLAVLTILAPFNVHRSLIMLLDDHRIAGEFQNVGIVQREMVSFGFWHIDDLRAAPGLARFGENHLDQLAAHVAADDRCLTLSQCVFVHIKLVGIDLALHHGFAQAVAGGDEDHAVKAGFGIQREHHAGGAGIRTHHALDACGQRYMRVIEALMHAIGNRTVVIQRSEHFLDRMQDVVIALNVQISFLLAGERGIRQILGRCRRAHGKSHPGATGGDQRVVFLFDFVFQVLGEWRVEHPVADLRTGFRQLIDVIDIQRVQCSIDAVGQALMGEKLAVGRRRGGEAARHADAGSRELGNHFTQRGILAAHLADIGHAQMIEGNGVTMRKRVLR